MLPGLRTKARHLQGLLALLCLSLTGCGGVSTGTLGAAQVRFVEVAPGAPEMDFYVNGSGAAYGIGYETFTSYLPVSPGTATISVNKAGAGQLLGTTQGNLTGGHQYTAVVSHGLANLQEHIYQDQDTPAPAGQIAVRMLNEVEGGGPLTLFLAPAAFPSRSHTASPAFTLASGGSTAYLLLPAGTDYLLTAAQPDKTLAVPLATVTLKGVSAAVRTVVFAGTIQASGHANVVGFTLSDVEAE